MDILPSEIVTLPPAGTLLADLAARTVDMSGPDADHFPACAAGQLGPWLIEEDWLRQAVVNLQAGLWIVHPKAAVRTDETGEPAYYLTGDGIAQISLAGPLQKGQSKFGGTSTVRTRQAIRQASRDEAVKGIMLLIDSPGGSCSGTAELAADVAEAARSKPVHAHIEDLGASAAYWIASQASRVSANQTALVGSIGTVAVVTDTSGSLAKDGVKVHVISTGEYKGAFTPGTEVTKEHLEYLQGYVDDLNSHFLAGISAGRKMPMDAVQKTADGRVHIAARAKALGLLDAVEGQDASMAALRAAVANPRKDMTMDANTKTETPMLSPATAVAVKTVKAAPPPPPEAPKAEPAPAAPATMADALPDAFQNGMEFAKVEARKFIEAFGPKGAEWFAEGKTFAEAAQLHAGDLVARNNALEAENAKLKNRTDPARGAPAALSSTPPAVPGGSTGPAKREPQGLEGALLAKFTDRNQG